MNDPWRLCLFKKKEMCSWSIEVWPSRCFSTRWLVMSRFFFNALQSTPPFFLITLHCFLSSPWGDSDAQGRVFPLWAKAGTCLSGSKKIGNQILGVVFLFFYCGVAMQSAAWFVVILFFWLGGLLFNVFFLIYSIYGFNLRININNFCLPESKHK